MNIRGIGHTNLSHFQARRETPEPSGDDFAARLRATAMPSAAIPHQLRPEEEDCVTIGKRLTDAAIANGAYGLIVLRLRRLGIEPTEIAPISISGVSASGGLSSNTSGSGQQRGQHQGGQPGQSQDEELFEVTGIDGKFPKTVASMLQAAVTKHNPVEVQDLVDHGFRLAQLTHETRMQAIRNLGKTSSH